MANQGLFNDSNLQVLRINDFTPGIVRFSRGSYPVVYPSVAPVGSAASAFRCYARPGVGLVPFPTYQQTQTFSQTGTGGQNWILSISSMYALSTNFDDSLVTAFSALAGTAGVGTPTHYLTLTRKFIPTTATPTVGTPTTVYSNNWSNSFTNLSDWSGMDAGLFQNASAPGGWVRSVLTADNNATQTPSQPLWVSVPDWASTADSNSGNLAAPAFEAPRIIYHGSRMAVLQSPTMTTAGSFISTNGDIMTVSATPLVLQPFSTVGVFFAELGSIVGTWGSVSTGELFMLYTQGGAVLVYGDLLYPTQVIKLPGVVGTGNTIGKAALSSIGLVYATEADGVYAWNGGNTSEKISAQVPDDVFHRTPPPGTARPPDHWFNSSQATWGQWIMFPNNWVYDQLTRSWWNCEDTGVLNFQVHAPSVSGEFFHSAPGFVNNSNGAALTIGTYRWDRYLPASSYTWVSNPIPASLGALVTISTVEIVASNPASAAATITITPTVPAGQTAFPNQNPTQPVTFTVPATTVADRQLLRLGYTAQNIQIQVQASNTGSNPAPTIHEINVGYTLTRTSGVA